MAPISTLVVVASNRAADGVYVDTSGPILIQGFAAAGFDVAGPVVVHDGDEVEQALRDAVDDGFALVVTSGGTGLTPLDLTPEMTRRVIDREVPGIAEALRAAGLAKTPHAALSRGIAGTAGKTLIVNLAGSAGAAKDGLAVLTAELIEHAVSQLHGGDHARTDAAKDPGATPEFSDVASVAQVHGTGATHAPGESAVGPDSGAAPGSSGTDTAHAPGDDTDAH
ncbi:MogA/MoaB family molybdenum cofactor biosynthesis protein [Glycomyces tritici]|uniref:MogA/MoaB family molybdenum cofactor biosynthesis protein n=1 Tax=Glycomyces tritici TaxID=2665176 RepID=A0ABT7YRL6_9ACTN|nr:MogA/MoaB family molybdenum cofactor biosynthesis protein [Glycomyces tritici]MDN3241274.1 MogA/MoaB family molybdenum cofactor biosynthesis protein [Glycomyces tritici]MDN3243297.1 MogA/MoaB family molybdenum cofactor biosynthesis protein [Glycomyces tritici]